MSARFIARGVCRPSANAIADGARISQFASPSVWWPSHERVSEPLRPAWPSWTATLDALNSWMKSLTRFHAPTCSGAYMPAQCRLMRPSGSTSVISVMTRPAPPTARLPRCTRCQSVGDAVLGRIHAHRRYRDAVGEGDAAQRDRREHRRRRAVAAAVGLRRDQRVDAAHQLRRHLLDAGIGDAHAGGEQREHELLERHADVLVDVLEPALARPGRALQALGLRPARGVEGFQRVLDGGVRGEKLGERLGVFHAGADIQPDREVRGVGGLTHQHGLAGVPAARADRDERAPCCVCRRRHAVERIGEVLAAEREDGVGVGVFEPVGEDGCFGGFDDHGRAAGLRPGDDVHHAAGRLAEAVAQRVPRLRGFERNKEIGAGRRFGRRRVRN